MIVPDAHPWLKSGRFMLIAGMIPALLMVGFLVYLTVWAVVFSFTDLTLVGPKSINWSWAGLENYERMLFRRGFLESLWTTTIFTFFSAIVGQSMLGFLFAAVLRTQKSFLRSFVETCLILGWLLPDIVAAFLWASTTAKTGFINTLILVPLGFEPINFLNEYALTVVIIANIWKGTAWSYLLFVAVLDAVPKEVLEAAKVDGATPLQRTLRVTLPMIRQHIATNMLFITMWTFSYFALIFSLTGGGPGNDTKVLSILMYQQSFGVGKLGYGAAVSVGMMVIVGFLTIFYVRLLKEPK
jgi:multiple sugar transport system permease protein